MTRVLLIGVGGFAGSVLRYWVSGLAQDAARDSLFPWGTLAVNLLGCLAIGALVQLAEARGADLASWSFLTGPPEVVDAALRAFGVGKSPGKDGEIDHLVVTFLVDPEGRIARRWVGLDHEADEILADLERMSAG